MVILYETNRKSPFFKILFNKNPAININRMIKFHCVACPLKRRRHKGITIRPLASSSASQKISVTFFSGTTEASFLIFGTEHQYGKLYRVTHF